MSVLACVHCTCSDRKQSTCDLFSGACFRIYFTAYFTAYFTIKESMIVVYFANNITNC